MIPFLGARSGVQSQQLLLRKVEASLGYVRTADAYKRQKNTASRKLVALLGRKCTISTVNRHCRLACRGAGAVCDSHLFQIRLHIVVLQWTITDKHSYGQRRRALLWDPGGLNEAALE